LKSAIDALSEEYGAGYARSVLKSPEALEAVYNQLGGDQAFAAEGAAIKIRAGIHAAGPGRSAFS
jgi:hypothetical protein